MRRTEFRSPLASADGLSALRNGSRSHGSAVLLAVTLGFMWACEARLADRPIDGAGGSGGQAGAGGASSAGGEGGDPSSGGSGGSWEDCDFDENCPCVLDCCPGTLGTFPIGPPDEYPLRCPPEFFPRDTCSDESCSCAPPRLTGCYSCCDRFADTIEPALCSDGEWECPWWAPDWQKSCDCTCDELQPKFAGERCDADGVLVCDLTEDIISGHCDGSVVCMGCFPSDRWENDSCRCSCGDDQAVRCRPI